MACRKLTKQGSQAARLRSGPGWSALASYFPTSLSLVLISLGLCVSAVKAPDANAQEWTRFRGPNGTGISTAKNIPTTFTDADLNWKVELPGAGHSSPVVWKDKLFITSADEANGKRFALCLRTTDGKMLWTNAYPFTAYTHHSFNNAASTTPAVDADHVYVVWPAPESVTVHAISHQGKEVWKRDLGSFQTMHGGGMSPIVVGDLVIVAKEQEMGEGSLIALNRKTGELRWKHDHVNKNAAYSTPFVYQPKGGAPQVICTNSAGFVSLDPATGKPNWELPSVFTARCVGSPVLVNDMIFATAGTGGGDRQAVAVRPGTKDAPAKVVYQPTKGICYVPTPIVYGDRIYMWGDGGIVTCLRAADGEQVWMERAGLGPFFGSPVCIDGKIYAVSSKGELIVIATGDQFKVLGVTPLGEACHSTPAVSGGAMYLRTVSHVISVGGKKP